MRPGVTTLPEASRTRNALSAGISGSTASMTPKRMPTSRRPLRLWLGSSTSPPLRTRSNLSFGPMAAAATPVLRLVVVSANREAERVRNSRRDEVNVEVNMVRSLPVILRAVDRRSLVLIAIKSGLRPDCSFRRDRGRLFGLRHAAAAPQPRLQAIEIEVDHGGRVEREQLAQRQSADHRVAERLAQLRSGAAAERQGQAGEHGGGGRHQDRTEA